MGKLTASMLVPGKETEELPPFTFSRYAEGATFSDRSSNCPWA